VDGQLENTDTSSVPTTITPSDDLYIGRDGHDEAELKWNGAIDEVRIYDRTLTAEEIAARYKNTEPTTASEDTLGAAVNIGFIIGIILIACVIIVVLLLKKKKRDEREEQAAPYGADFGIPEEPEGIMEEIPRRREKKKEFPKRL